MRLPRTDTIKQTPVHLTEPAMYASHCISNTYTRGFDDVVIAEGYITIAALIYRSYMRIGSSERERERETKE